MSFDTKDLDIRSHVRCSDEDLNEAVLAVENAARQQPGSLRDLQAAIDLLGHEVAVTLVPLINVGDGKNLADILKEAQPLIDLAKRNRKNEALHDKLHEDLPSTGVFQSGIKI